MEGVCEDDVDCEDDCVKLAVKVGDTLELDVWLAVLLRVDDRVAVLVILDVIDALSDGVRESLEDDVGVAEILGEILAEKV